MEKSYIYPSYFSDEKIKVTMIMKKYIYIIKIIIAIMIHNPRLVEGP